VIEPHKALILLCFVLRWWSNICMI
jgi:hypothetical protein